jgi:hypothetical protein
MDTAFAWIPLRIHLTETVVFPPYASWEDPEKVFIFRFPLYKKLVLLFLLVLLCHLLHAKRFRSALSVLIIPPVIHYVFLKHAVWV